MISVLMSVFNDERTVEEAVQSILAQTFTNFEFIIINDGSTDKTGEMLRKLALQDDRIVLVNQANCGLTKSLNFAASMAKYEILARQDADDFSYERRLETQIIAFENENLVLLGSDAINIYDDGARDHWGFFDKIEIKERVKYCAPFPHSTVMMRKSSFDQVGGYNKRMQTSQDMDLWMRLAKVGEVSMLEEKLVGRRVRSSSVSGKKKLRQFRDALYSRLRNNNGRSFKLIIFSLRGLIISCLPMGVSKALRSIKSRK